MSGYKFSFYKCSLSYYYVPDTVLGVLQTQQGEKDIHLQTKIENTARPNICAYAK